MEPNRERKLAVVDPIRKVQAERPSLWEFWLGRSKQTPVQRLGFFIISLFCALVGGSLWLAFWSEPSRRGVLVLAVGALPLAVGVSGLLKSVSD